MTVISKDIHERVNQMRVEMNESLIERHQVIDSIVIGRIAQQHVVMLGPGGTAKSMAARSLAEHILDSVYFEVALDEQSIVDEVFGPTDIKNMVESGKMQRFLDGTAGEATDCFFDEFFNATGPVLHALMPLLNERVVHSNGVSGRPLPAPLRQAIMGTNKLNADADLAALWDRVHIREIVNYVQARTNRAKMVTAAIARLYQKGRGTATRLDGDITTVTVAELDKAHKEALALDYSDTTTDLLFDIQEELASKGIIISDRRIVEGTVATLANAWLRGHEVVQPIDLDILARMWWTVQDQEPTARAIILQATNPGEKAALDLLDLLDGIRTEMANAESSGLDDERKRRVGVQAIRDTDKLIRETETNLDKAKAAQLSTARLEEVLAKAESFKYSVGRDVFGIDQGDMKKMANA
jgi:MoxR-like ATPase